MSENVQVDEKPSSSEVISIPIKKPRPTKETWLKARVDYETGDFQDLNQLSIKYGLNYDNLRQKVHREEWREFDVTVSAKVSQKVVEKVENKVDLFFSHLEKKGIYYEKLVEASQAQASRNNEGIPELEPPDLEKYARVEGIAIEWRKTALGIKDNPTAISVDVNVLSILQQVRQARTAETVVDVESEVADLKEIVKNLGNQVS